MIAEAGLFVVLSDAQSSTVKALKGCDVNAKWFEIQIRLFPV